MADHTIQHHYHNRWYNWLLRNLCIGHLSGCTHLHTWHTRGGNLYKLNTISIQTKMFGCGYIQNQNVLVPYPVVAESVPCCWIIGWLVVRQWQYNNQ